MLLWIILPNECSNWVICLMNLEIVGYLTGCQLSLHVYGQGYLRVLKSEAVFVWVLGQASGPAAGLILLQILVHWHVLVSALPTGFLLFGIFSEMLAHNYFILNLVKCT